MAAHPAWTKRLLSDADLDAITGAIAAAESHTSGMIKVHLERRVHGHRGDALARAKDVFAHLQMHLTVERHAVLIYLALEDRKLAVIGDAGIHARVGDAYWDTIRDHMVTCLRAGAPREAVVGAVDEVGRVLREHFPRRPGDVQDSSDDLTVE
jgi:uncharacterized membrane protein